ncbi:MAG: hypothetical protein DI566_02435 [Microbacterium sp.]|nr:MAG: hypothetical protein DI566_02435 [Microbacterium sp.]
MRKFFKTKVLLWPVLLIVVVFIGAVGAAAAFGAVNTLALGSIFGSSSQQRNDQVIQSVERKEEVVLVQLGIIGLVDKKTTAKIGEFEIPWTDRTVFLRYSFDAKLGIDGSAVEITPKGDNAYVITIPEFMFIGLDNSIAEIAAESNGALSWTTQEIDDQKMRNEIVNDGAKAEYIARNLDLLHSQTEAFYSGIVHAVDPTATLEFQFAE